MAAIGFLVNVTNFNLQRRHMDAADAITGGFAEPIPHSRMCETKLLRDGTLHLHAKLFRRFARVNNVVKCIEHATVRGHTRIQVFQCIHG